MTSPQENLMYDTAEAAPAPMEANGSVRLSAAEPSLSGTRLGPAVESPQERLADGNEAYADARERQLEHGLDEEAVRLYRKASFDLMAAEISQMREGGPVDPKIMLKRAACLGWQAEATPYGVFYPSPHSHVDVKSNLQELATKELTAANDILLGRKPETATGAPDMASISPGLVAEVAAEAAEEAGTAEHILPEMLAAEGVEGIERFVGEQAMSGEHGGRFVALVADKEVTGLHELPLAA